MLDKKTVKKNDKDREIDPNEADMSQDDIDELEYERQEGKYDGQT